MITRIWADEKKVHFTTGAKHEGSVEISAYSPALSERLLLGKAAAEQGDGELTVDRYAFGRDGAFLRYESELGGVKYVTQTSSRETAPFPDPGTVKGLQISDAEDAKILGVRHSAINVAITDFLCSGNDPDYRDGIIPFEYDGYTYYFNEKQVRLQDRKIRSLTDAGLVVYLILLCGKHWMKKVDEDMKDVLLHPAYDNEGTLSAFNVETDVGIRHYQAFTAFLAKRYALSGGEYGRALGMIISNEVTSQWIWGNAGEKTIEEFSSEYLTAMRIAYLAATSEFSDFRVYISMDHFWGISMDAKYPNRYYAGLPLLNEIGRIAKAEGDFFYNIAHHPYPEDLNEPDFWNDKNATDDYETPIVTFKNLHILADFIHREENMFEGKARRIILSEQGFNSKWTPESEILQATAYGRAYHEVMKIPEIDAFILHAHHDARFEFGLNLGLWRRKPDGDEMERPKPAYYLFKVIDQKDDTGRYWWERF